MPSGLLTPTEVAAMFRVSPSTVARWVRQKKLEAVRTPGGRNLFRAEDVDAFTRRRGQSSVTRGITDRMVRELEGRG